jgi:flavin-binding protein dodecin
MSSADGPMGKGLTFTGMTDLGISRGLDLSFHLADKSLDLFLCVGTSGNRVKISGTTPASRQAAVLNAIDQNAKWGEEIDLWMVSEKAGVVQARTAHVKHKAHVKPYYGQLKVSAIAADLPAMTYPGNGKGRLLSKAINGRYYFIYGGKLEADNAMRGFDCTSFPMALLSIPSLPQPGYGKQLCDAAGAVPCSLDQLKSAVLKQRFTEDTIPVGLYVLFSAGHVMLYNSDMNMLYEFNYGGFKSWSAPTRQLNAPQDLWWLRKLAETHRAAFS